MSEETELIVEDHGPVRHIILNRPRKLNAIDYAQHLRLLNAFESARDDDKVKVVALSGMGRAYCSGDDLSASRYEGTDPMRDRHVDLEMGSGPVLLLHSCAVLRSLPKPTVALMHGAALGSGYDYSLSCDFRLVTSNIVYGDPRIHRALWAAEGWSYKLPRLLNQSSVAPIAYLGETLDADSAVDSGLVHFVTADEPNVRTASNWFLEKLVSASGPSYAKTKKLLLHSIDATFDQSQLMAEAIT